MYVLRTSLWIVERRDGTRSTGSPSYQGISEREGNDGQVEKEGKEKRIERDTEGDK
jgi:hypothetical protein